jgi:hypothetical protein
MKEADDVKDCTEWYSLYALADKAETEYAKKHINSRASFLYHKEEALCDCL